jgi:beta-galactosidase
LAIQHKGRKKAAARKKARAERDGVRLVGRTLRVGDQRVPLYSGAMHYFRLDPDAWRPGLAELRGLGLPIVETYVPWGAHEVAPGELDFGEKDPRLDVGRFIDLAGELGLYVFIRPGPHINAEMTWFGLPERVVYDKACQARSPRQNPVILPFPPRMFPVPSYASRAFHHETGRWYDAVARVLVPRLWPKGPIVLLQVDNEAAYYFRNGPFDQDYHPDAVEAYRRFLEKRYGTPEAAARAHRAEYAHWDDAEPPTSFEAERPDELVVHLDWAEFQESLITRALGRMRRRMAQAGLEGVPITHNVALGESGLPVSIPGIERTVDLMGLDYYHSAREHRTIKRRTLYLTGTVGLPYSPEMGVGAPPWFTPLTHDDSLYCAMCACAYGLRGFNLYMAVDRDRWYGAPIDARGTPRLESGAWKAFVTRLLELRFHELTRKVEVGLQIPAEYKRLSRATHLLGGLASPANVEAMGGTPVDACRESPLGFKGPVQILWWRMLAKVSDALTAAGVPYVYVDSDAPEERLADLRVLVAPSYEYASTARWKKIARAAQNGTHVVYGPAMPELDERMRVQLFEVPKDGRRLLIDTPDDARALVDELVLAHDLARPFRASPAPVETAVHEDAVGPRIVFVMNPGRAPLDAQIELPGPMGMLDMMTGERLEGDEHARIPLGGLSCRVLVLEPSRASADKAGARRPAARRKAS